MTFNLPTSVIFVTNYGVFVFEYPVDLTDTQALINYYDLNPILPLTKRQIGLNFDSYGEETIRNPFGNAFFVKSRFEGSTHEIYQTKLVSMSYFSAINSQVFKILDIV